LWKKPVLPLVIVLLAGAFSSKMGFPEWRSTLFNQGATRRLNDDANAAPH
jgi:hypothetical protein